MNKDIMEAMVKSLNTGSANEQVVAEYYFLGTAGKIDIEGKTYRIENNRIVDQDNIIYHTREEIFGHKHVCPVCGETDVAETIATPVISVNVGNSGIIVNDGMSGYDYGITEDTALYCPYCNAKMVDFDKIDEEICVPGIVYPYCPPPSTQDIFASLSEYLWECIKCGGNDFWVEEMGMTVEDAVISYMYSKYSGFIRLYGIEQAMILDKTKEGIEQWYAANVVRY